MALIEIGCDPEDVTPPSPDPKPAKPPKFDDAADGANAVCTTWNVQSQSKSGETGIDGLPGVNGDPGNNGTDIGPLGKNNKETVLIGLMPDSQRYFEVHHAASDTFDKINQRELALGAGSMAALVYLLSEYGL